MDLREKARLNRLESNKRLSNLVTNNEHIPSTFTTQGSWFPPRPLIKKDKKIMKRLYDEDDEKPLKIT